MSQAPTREPILLQDYRPPAFLTPEIELDFVLEPEATLVTARQRFERNPAAAGAEDLVLRGEAQELLALGHRRRAAAQRAATGSRTTG